MAVSVVQSVAAAQQFVVPDLLPWRFLNHSLLTKLLYNQSILAHPQAGKLRSLGCLLLWKWLFGGLILRVVWACIASPLVIASGPYYEHPVAPAAPRYSPVSVARPVPHSSRVLGVARCGWHRLQ
jgi:hypothetical protein